jgi:hypothetical protein
MASRFQYLESTNPATGGVGSQTRRVQQLRRSARRDELGELSENGLIPARRRSPKFSESDQ